MNRRRLWLTAVAAAACAPNLPVRAQARPLRCAVGPFLPSPEGTRKAYTPFFAHVVSGGEQQRVMIARALAQSPRVLLADEPVASLDPDNAARIMDLLRARAARGMAVLASLHQPQLAHAYATRVLRIEQGRLQEAPTRG